jgi:protein-S-isoprenylcysteine O-methyltransferase Ste14
MSDLCRLIWCAMVGLVRSRAALQAEILQRLSAWALLLLGLVWAFQLQHMKYEELVLFQGFPEYGDYMARTARLVPGVY